MHRAFTLVEVMAVVVLLGLLAAATAWSLADESHRSAQEDVIAQIAYADYKLRTSALRLGKPVLLEFDLDHQQVRQYAEAEGGHDTMRPSVKFPKDTRLEAVAVAGRSRDGGGRRYETGVQWVDYGTIEMPCSTIGRTPTYVLRIELTRTTTWLVVSGMTGQVVRMDDEDEVDKLLATLATGRPDTD